ncbi:molybdenum cofactor guanylyltransferase [Georgenia wangjunii]|uniref:molybdenum cofactor guanylyltransferase n=1 Tax=Georgenia wangjunii TaxID=3117730 RepID=UPI002F264300
MTVAAEPADAPFDAVVLAGGTARRLGGASKPDVELSGRRLLDHALDATAGARRTVVVAPASVAVPPGVLRTLEDPPHGGPVAGIAAGLDALESAGTTDGGAPAPAPLPALVLVLACDVPGAAGAVPGLVRAALASPGGACLVDADGRRQWLVGVYRRAALRTRLAALAGGRDVGVRALLGDLPLAEVRARGSESTDVDTWSDLAALARAEEAPDDGSPARTV